MIPEVALGVPNIWKSCVAARTAKMDVKMVAVDEISICDDNVEDEPWGYAKLSIKSPN